MKNTETLLSIRNLKKYFPVAKTRFFQKEQLYVRANEEISIDIRSGETFGLVGESGCGKSTLGRTILQLYDQTAGSTMYYGRTLEDFAPAYVTVTLKKANKLLEAYRKQQVKADAAAAEVEKAGDKATFYQHQTMNLLQAEAETAFQGVVKILGGFAALDDPQEGAAALLKAYGTTTRLCRLNDRMRDLDAEIAFHEAVARELEEDPAAKRAAGKIRRSLRRAEKFRARRRALEPEAARLRAIRQDEEAAVDALRAKYADDEMFQKYEAMRDTGIDLSRLRYTEMRILRKDIQIIFQDPYSSLNPRMTVGQIIGEGLTTHKFFKSRDPKMKEYILQIMEKCGLQGYMLHRYPHQFSGGQRCSM